MFADDNDLRYTESQGVPDGRLTLDDAYRLAHLPLVNPAHPDVIPRHDGTDYDMGRYDRARISLVAPVPYRHLGVSATFNRVLADLRASPLGGKIHWDSFERRKDRLHLTICGRLETKLSAPEIDAAIPVIARHAAFRVRLGGPWIGSMNTGRIYLPVYPERKGPEDSLRLVQRSLNWPESRLYVVGLWNLTDHLDMAETSALQHFIARYSGEILSEILIDELHLTTTHDDMALSGQTRNVMKLQPIHRA